jgi:1-acyl-sn-glycerol-3-phosphate acyltransferase
VGAHLVRVFRLFAAATVVTVMTGALAPPLILISFFTRSGTPGYVIARTWAWLVAKFIGVSASIHGAERAVPGASYIVTPNHQSQVDILALMVTLPTRFRWVIKKELVKIPIFGWALARTGAVSLNRSNPREALKTLQQGSDKLMGGWSLLIYPEGTRSPDGNLLPFKKGAFVLAVNTGIPILPVTVNGAAKILPKKSLVVRPGHISITIGDPIPTDGLHDADVPILMEKTRDAIAKHLDPEYDPFNHVQGK